MEWQEVHQCMADKTAVKYKCCARSFAIHGIEDVPFMTRYIDLVPCLIDYTGHVVDIDDSEVHIAWPNNIEPINIEEYDQGW